ncbi:1393_t:CDS:2, partial [Dentiscutata heterogama]
TIESETSIVKKPVITFITLVCYDRFEKPHKKLDSVLAIPYDIDNIKDFGSIEKEILLCTLPKQWGKIELGHICYQLSNTSKANHYDLKADGAIVAFINEIKFKKNIQLCVYQDTESYRTNKRIRV